MKADEGVGTAVDQVTFDHNGHKCTVTVTTDGALNSAHGHTDSHLRLSTRPGGSFLEAEKGKKEEDKERRR